MTDGSARTRPSGPRAAGRSRAGTPSAEVPLARLFAAGYASLVDELHRRLAQRGWVGVRPAFGFVLLALRSASLTPSQLAAHLRVSKQAASKLADAMVEAGLVDRVAHETDGRARRLSLSARGMALLAEVEDVYHDLEREWAALVGADALEHLRATLTSVLTRTHGAMPPIRPPDDGLTR